MGLCNLVCDYLNLLLELARRLLGFDWFANRLGFGLHCGSHKGYFRFFDLYRRSILKAANVRLYLPDHKRFLVLAGVSP